MCGQPLANVMAFKYMGRILTSIDADWPAVVTNLQKSREKWVCLSLILGLEGVGRRTLGIFFHLVVQAFLLFGSEI